MNNDLYPIFLAFMTLLFALSAGLLLLMTIAQALRSRGRRVAVYLGLTFLAGVVAFGFYFVRRAIG